MLLLADHTHWLRPRSRQGFGPQFSFFAGPSAGSEAGGFASMSVSATAWPHMCVSQGAAAVRMSETKIESLTGRKTAFVGGGQDLHQIH
eukprot:COSAG06_NODE_16285_length_1009_cov_0.641758_2_plen_89_part_00